MNSKTYKHLSTDDTYKLVATFITDNNLEAWWMSSHQGYLALGIVTELEDEEEEDEP